MVFVGIEMRLFFVYLQALRKMSLIWPLSFLKRSLLHTDSMFSELPARTRSPGLRDQYIAHLLYPTIISYASLQALNFRWSRVTSSGRWECSVFPKDTHRFKINPRVSLVMALRLSAAIGTSCWLQLSPAVSEELILCRTLLDLAVGRKDRRKLKISPRLDTALLQLHSVITSSAISRLVNFPWLTAADGSIAENALVQLHK